MVQRNQVRSFRPSQGGGDGGRRGLGVVVEGRVQVQSAEPRYGWQYESVTQLAPPANVAPLAFAATRLAVADLLP
jgi:hypothetical protein